MTAGSPAQRAGPLRFPCDTVVLADVRAAVRAFAREQGASDEVADDLVLAADEICSNVVVHAYSQPAPGGDPGFTVDLEAAPEGIVVTVRDWGVAFDQTAQPPRSLDEWLARGRKGGLGLPLLRALVDDLRYERTPGGCNEVRIAKQLR